MRRSRAPWLLSVLSLSWLYGCSTSGIRIDQNQDAKVDQPYQQAMHAASKHATIYRDFETKYALTASFFSPEFTAAFKNRAQRISLPNPSNFTKHQHHYLFFVSIYVPDAKQFNLSEKNLWTIKMHCAGQEWEPEAVEEIKRKEYWQSFFPFISTWSKEYLLVFPRSKAPSPCENNRHDLSIANADAKVTMSWEPSQT